MSSRIPSPSPHHRPRSLTPNQSSHSRSHIPTRSRSRSRSREARVHGAHLHQAPVEVVHYEATTAHSHHHHPHHEPSNTHPDLNGFSQSSFTPVSPADSVTDSHLHHHHHEHPHGDDIPLGSINLDEITVAHVEKVSIGKPCPKPLDSISGPSSTGKDDKTAQENIRIVASNIRRKKMVVGLFLFIQCAIPLAGFWNLGYNIFFADPFLFSYSIIGVWMEPIIGLQMLITLFGVVVTIIKMRLLEKRWAKRMFRLTMTINGIEYLLAMLLVPIAIYFFTSQLTVAMQNTIEAGFDPEASPQWHHTQMKRKCCGLHNRTDWIMPEDDHENMADERFYPPSCCKNPIVDPATSIGHCSEKSETFWKNGCHQVEFFIILDNMLWFLGLVFVAFVLTVTIRLWVDKLERYLIIFRPREVF